MVVSGPMDFVFFDNKIKAGKNEKCIWRQRNTTIMNV